MSYPEPLPSDAPLEKGYFNSMRRKTGLVTMLVACGFLGLWSRSFLSTNDQVTVWDNHSLYSRDGSISWNIRYTDFQPPVQTVFEQPEIATSAALNAYAEHVPDGKTASEASQQGQVVSQIQLHSGHTPLSRRTRTCEVFPFRSASATFAGTLRGLSSLVRVR